MSETATAMRSAGAPAQRVVAWREALRDAIRANDRAGLRRVPKTDLHCHGLLSAPDATYAELLGRPLPPRPLVFGSFAAFSNYITSNLLPVMTGPASVRQVLRGGLDRLVEDGVVYAEVSFDVLVPDFIGIRCEAFSELVAEEAERVRDRLHLSADIGISRVVPPDEAEWRAKMWMATGVFRGIDLYDDETAGVTQDFAPLYRLAADKGLKRKAHAGEMCGAAGVRESVEALELDAVQHGVRAAEDPSVVDLLAERGVTLNICPTSNLALGVCASYEAHPARELVARGVRITVNSDDYALFGADVCDELLNLVRMGFDLDQIEAAVATGLAQIPPA